MNKNNCTRRITFNEDINRWNFLGCLLHYFILSFTFVSIDSLQPLLLQQKYNIDKSDQIQNFRNSIVIGCDIMVKIICAPIFGYLTDYLGRKKINLYGIIWISSAMILMPFTGQFWEYILLRCLYAQGAIAISVLPLLGDYVAHKSRGVCAAILVFMSSLGAVSSAFINFTILKSIDISYKIYVQYIVVSSIILIIGLSYTLFLLKSGNTYYKKQALISSKKTFKQLYQIGITSFKMPQILTGYLSAFLARSDSILLSLYLVLWTYSFHQDDYQNSSSKAQALSGIAYVVIMFSCILYGYFYERKNINRRNLLIAMLLLAAIGSALINLSKQINSLITYLSLGILGLGMSGLLTASLYLINEFSSTQNRGYLVGLQTIFGVIGITFETFIGAILYSYYRSGPFNLFASSCLFCIIVTIIIYYKYSIKVSNDISNESLIQTINGDNEQILQ